MPAVPPPAVTVIIVNYNAGDRLARCLAHLARQSFRDFETVIVDNASSDGSLAAARAADPGFRLIEAGGNIGFAAANNLAAREAAGEWLALLNPDAYPEPHWLAALMAAARALPDVDAFGSTQLMADDPARLDGAGDVASVYGLAYRGGFGWPASDAPSDGECFAPCAAAALYRKARFLALGGFDARFFCYGEDVDFGFRLRLAGGRAVQLRAARVAHEGSGLTGRHSAFALYHGHRNRIWLYYKNLAGPAYWLTAPLRLMADALLFARAAMAGEAGAYLKALRDGYGGLKTFRADRAAAASAPVGAGAILRRLVWSPLKVARRAPALRPLAPPVRPESPSP